MNNGPYNNLTARKFVLTCTPQASWRPRRRPPRRRRRQLQRRPTANRVDAALARLQPMFFDANVDPIVTNKTPGAGKDILQSSANNLYSGVSMADLKGFTEKYGLNSRLVKQDGKLVEEVYRVDGRYGAQIAEIVKHLEAAKPFAEPTDGQGARRPHQVLSHRRRGRSRGVRHRVGRRTRRRRSTRSTASSRSTSIRAASRAAGRAWSSTSTRRRRSASRSSPSNAQWFEDHMPWEAKYRKAERAGHRRQRHRRHRRNRRLGPGDADRHQPAERPGDPREVRQQVGGARRTSTRPTTSPRRGRCAASSRGTRPKPVAPRSSRPSAAN